MRGARIISGADLVLEAGVVFAVGATAAAFAGVPSWAQVGLGSISAALAAALLVHAVTARRLRARLGPNPVALHPTGRWLTVWPDHAAAGRVIELDARADLRAPLLAPGMLLAALGFVQCLPLAGAARSVAPAETAKAVGLVVCAVVLHVAACVSGQDPSAARRRVSALTVIGFAVAIASLGLYASEDRALWSLFDPPEAGIPFGPFWYRNHFAVWAAMLAVVSLAPFGRAVVGAWRRRRHRAGLAAHLAEPETLTVIERALPPLAMLASIVATTSRGAALALLAGLVAWSAVAAGSLRRRLLPLATIAVFLAVALFWFGADRLTDRFGRAPADAAGRMLGWSTALDLARERPLLGWGLGSYEQAVAIDAARAAALRAVHPHLARAAHNDYLQMTAETGVVGLALVLWSATPALVAATREPWRFAALTVGLAHAVVDFDWHVPALVVLLAVLSAPAKAYATVRA